MNYGTFSTGVTYSFHDQNDVGRFNGEDISGSSEDDVFCHRWLAEDRPIVLAIVRAYEHYIGLPAMDFQKYVGLSGLERMMRQFEGRELDRFHHRYLFGCSVYQQLKDLDRLLFLYD